MSPFRSLPPRSLVRRGVLSAALLGWTLIPFGCQLLTLSELESPPTTVAEKPNPLEPLLAGVTWDVDRSWSALNVTSALPGATPSDNPLDPARWRFSLPEQAAAPTPQDQASNDLTSSAFQWLKNIANDDDSSDRRAPNDIQDALTPLSQKWTAPGWTAAILAAEFADDPQRAAGLHELWTAYLNKPSAERAAIPTKVQAAAAEVWCRALARLDGNAEETFALAGQLLEEPDLPEEVRGELFRGIARRIAPRQIPGLNDVMVRNESAKVASPIHLAAVEACTLHAWRLRRAGKGVEFDADAWPDGLAACRFSDDAALRKLYARWAVLARHPDALTVAKSQRLDNDLGVREAAVTSLGLIGGDAAHRELQSVLSKGTDPERVAAIACLAQQGIDAVLPYAHDDSPRVRAAVATALGKHPSATAVAALGELLTDRASDVQLAALHAGSSDAWKDFGRVSLWLHSLRVGSLSARKAALSRLREEWGREPYFPLEGSFEERDAAVRRLALEHGVSSDLLATFAGAERKSDSPAAPTLSQDAVREMVRNFLHASPERSAEALLDQLKSLEAAATPIIEQELQGVSGSRADQIFRDVLPRRHAGYAALAGLEHSDVVRRRRSAHELLEFSQRSSLSPCLLKRLSQRMVLEQDRQVWQDVLGSILPDALPEAAQIALVALNSPWPDIRQLGCEYFERHPQPEYAAWLLPKLRDADHQVRVRTIRLLARCGNPAALDGYPDDASSPGLRGFLTQSDQQLRWEAVVAMSRLGDAQAAQELIRQTYDPHPRQREQAVAAIGETGQARFVEPLLRRLWTENDLGVQVALLKSLDQLTPLDERPGLAPGASIGDKINGWARWWEERQRQRTATAASRNEPTR